MDTIGGYLCMLSGNVPAPNQTFSLHGWLLTVLDSDAKLIHRLRLEPAHPEERALIPVKRADADADLS